MGRAVAAGIALVIVAGVAVVGAVLLGGDDSGPDFAGKASELCDDARAEIEKLGDPIKEGLVVVLKRVEIGEQLVADLEELELPPEQESEAEALVFSLRAYYRSLRLGYEALRDNDRSALRAIEGAAEKALSDSEVAAAAIGADGCAVRPSA